MFYADYLTSISYGVAALGYAVLSLQLGIRVWPSPRGRLLLTACVASVCWAFAGVATGVWPERAVWRLYQAVDALTWGTWIGFLASLLLTGRNSRPALKWACSGLISLATLS